MSRAQRMQRLDGGDDDDGDTTYSAPARDAASSTGRMLGVGGNILALVFAIPALVIAIILLRPGAPEPVPPPPPPVDFQFGPGSSFTGGPPNATVRNVFPGPFINGNTTCLSQPQFEANGSAGPGTTCIPYTSFNWPLGANGGDLTGTTQQGFIRDSGVVPGFYAFPINMTILSDGRTSNVVNGTRPMYPGDPVVTSTLANTTFPNVDLALVPGLNGASWSFDPNFSVNASGDPYGRTTRVGPGLPLVIKGTVSNTTDIACIWGTGCTSLPSPYLIGGSQYTNISCLAGVIVHGTVGQPATTDNVEYVCVDLSSLGGNGGNLSAVLGTPHQVQVTTTGTVFFSLSAILSIPSLHHRQWDCSDGELLFHHNLPGNRGYFRPLLAPFGALCRQQPNHPIPGPSLGNGIHGHGRLVRSNSWQLCGSRWHQRQLCQPDV